MEIKESKRDTLYIMKAFAVISIVLSHTNIANIGNSYLKCFLSIYKPIGVYIFLILSGYLFNYKKYPNIKNLLIDKFKNIIIPWITCGLLTYASNFLLTPLHFDLMEIINWILGNGTYLYYLTVLMLIYIIIYLLPKNLKVYKIFIVLNIISIFLTQIGILNSVVDAEKIAFTYLNPYLNVFNWIGIFSFGLCLKHYDFFKQKINYNMFFLVFMLTILVITIFKIDINYWNIITPIIGIASFFLTFELSVELVNLKWLTNIGKKTFSIYLLHLPVVALFCRILSPKLCLLTSLLVVIIMYQILNIAEKISRKVYMDKIFSLLCGSR